MGTPNRWAVLTLGMAAQSAGCVFMYGLPFLLPALQAERNLGLAEAGILIGAPSAGMLATLIAWGWIADRYGERLAMTSGLALAALFLGVAAFSTHTVLLGTLIALAGACGASTHAASGRLVLGWFPTEKRGVAMGWRQTAQPLGVAAAGVLIPQFGDVRGPLLTMAALCLVTAILVGLFVVDPPRQEAGGAPPTAAYSEPTIWRVHGASMLLIVPQFATAGFALTYLVTIRGWSTAEAGAVIALAQLAGAAGRLAAGRWSDVAGSRVRPMRRLALVNGAIMLLLAVAVPTAFSTPLVIIALMITMSGNGLAFTAVSELAGSSFAGRALGAQNTGQNLVAAITPGLIALVISGSGYSLAFAMAGAVALTAALVTPGRDRPPVSGRTSKAADGPRRPAVGRRR